MGNICVLVISSIIGDFIIVVFNGDFVGFDGESGVLIGMGKGWVFLLMIGVKV